MTDQQHPITPPPELVEQWECEYHHLTSGPDFAVFISEKAARWGADRELEACCGLIGSAYVRDQVRAARRPRPLSLRELALASVKRLEESGEFFSDQMRELAFIRKALEQLDD